MHYLFYFMLDVRTTFAARTESEFVTSKFPYLYKSDKQFPAAQHMGLRRHFINLSARHDRINKTLSIKSVPWICGAVFDNTNSLLAARLTKNAGRENDGPLRREDARRICEKKILPPHLNSVVTLPWKSNSRRITLNLAYSLNQSGNEGNSFVAMLLWIHVLITPDNNSKRKNKGIINRIFL